jgi:hypothetical protein
MQGIMQMLQQMMGQRGGNAPGPKAPMQERPDFDPFAAGGGFGRYQQLFGVSGDGQQKPGDRIAPVKPGMGGGGGI